MDAIVATYLGWGIGKDGTQPVVIPEDRKRFHDMTMGGTIVYGHNTLKDYPGGKPLPGRENIVMSRDPNLVVEGATVAHSVEEVLKLIEGKEKVFLCGGMQTYFALMPYCEKCYITKIYDRPECDASIPNLDEQFDWTFDSESEIMVSETGLRYQFIVYDSYNISNDIRKYEKK